MGNNDNYYEYGFDGGDDGYDQDPGYVDYERTVLDPGPWLFVATTLFCCLLMLVAVPLMVWRERSR